jgi:hypothetical protein
MTKIDWNEYQAKATGELAHVVDATAQALFAVQRAIDGQAQSLDDIAKAHDKLADGMLYQCENSQEIAKAIAYLGVATEDSKAVNRIADALNRIARQLEMTNEV